MGGRGGSGGGLPEVKWPELTGSEKQKKWALDILNEPYINIRNRTQVSYWEKYYPEQYEWNKGVPKKMAKAYREVLTDFVQQMNQMPDTMKASVIIDRRHKYLENAYKKVEHDIEKKVGKNYTFGTQFRY